MRGIARRVMGAGALTLALAGGVEAQGLRLPDAGFIALGVARVDTGELDERLAASGYPTFGRRAVAPAIGVYWRLANGVMLGGEWAGLGLEGEDEETSGIGLGGGYGTVGIGYAVDLSSRARVYPRLGLGGGGMGLWFDREEEELAFDDALANPGAAVEPEREWVLSHGGVVVDLGAGLELLPGGRGRGPMIGLRFGYLANPFTTGWKLDGTGEGIPATGGPAATIAGPYLRVVVGAGRRR